MSDLNAQKLEDAILRHAKGGPTKRVDLPTYEVPEDDGWHYRTLDFEETIERFQNENPKAIIHEFDDGSDPCADVPIEPCPKWSTLYVSVYELHQSYGGPEEGGWWYDTGILQEYEPVRVSFHPDRTPYLKQSECEFLGELVEKWAKDYEEFDTHHRSSTRPRGQDFEWQVSWEIPEDFPKYRPHYE